MGEWGTALEDLARMVSPSCGFQGIIKSAVG